MSSVRPFLTAFLSLAFLIKTSLADSVFLKNGEKVEGRIVSESPEQLTIEVKVSAGITDERVIPRAEVDRIEKVAPDTLAYKSIATVQVGASSMEASQYDARIRALQSFVTQYPTSSHAIDVQTALNELVEEKKRVEGGERKLAGQWLSKEEVEREKVQINGQIALEYMKSQSAAGDGVGALNTFTVIEKSYPGSASFPESAELARQIVASLKPALDKAVDQQKALAAEKQKGFASAGPADRTEMMAAYKREQDQAEATVKAAETANQWPPFIIASDKSITALQARASRELTRLNALPVDKMKKSLQATALAREKIAAGELDAAATALKEATSLWATNELATRLTKEVTAQLKAKPPEAAAPATPEPKKEAPKSTPKPSAAAKEGAGAAAAGTEERKAFFLTLPGAIVIVVGIAGVLAGMNVFKKMQARKNAAE